MCLTRLEVGGIIMFMGRFHLLLHIFLLARIVAIIFQRSVEVHVSESFTESISGNLHRILCSGYRSLTVENLFKFSCNGIWQKASGCSGP